MYNFDNNSRMSETKAVEIGYRDQFGNSNDKVIMENDSENEKQCRKLKVLKKLNKLGSEDDLFTWRQLNSAYYEKLNSTFLDSATKAIRVLKMFDKELDKEVDDTVADIAHTQEQKLKIISDWKTNFVIECLTPKSDDYDVEGQDTKEITPQNWTPEIAHIFRQLELNQVWISNDSKKHHPLLYQIIPQVAPFITSLKLNTLLQDPKKHGKTMSAFLKTFPNLKILTIDVISMLNGSSGLIFQLKGLNEAIGQLEVGIANLKTNPKIHLNVELVTGFKEFLDIFANKKNITIYFKFEVFNSSLQLVVKSIFTQYGNLKNIKYCFKLRNGFQNLADMQTFTGLCTQLNDQNEHLALNLTFDGEDQSFEDADKVGIRKCLAKLSPYMNALFIWLYREDWDVLPHEMDWPKLNHLWIVGYHYPLQILKNCLSLEILVLCMDTIDECIFSNPKQSEKESLAEYFGNLPRLRELTFMSRLKPTGKFTPGTELDEYLKSILPRLQTIEYEAGPPRV